MKIMEHSVFAGAGIGFHIGLFLFPSLFAAQRDQKRESVRKKVEVFIKEIGVDSVVSITEDASSLGPFAVTVWWYRELPDKPEKPETDTSVIRPSEGNKTAYDYQWKPD